MLLVKYDFIFKRLSFKKKFFVIGFEQRKTNNLLWRDHFLRSEYIFNEKVIFFRKFGKQKKYRRIQEKRQKSAKMTRVDEKNSKMVVLKFQLIVLFCFINGRFAYRADDSNDYRYDSSSNFSQISNNEPPGKKICSNFLTVYCVLIFNILIFGLMLIRPNCSHYPNCFLK